MAKYRVGQLVVLAAHQIWWLADRNSRRRDSYGDEKVRKPLIGSLSHGWKVEKTQPIAVSFLTPEQIQQRVEQLEREWERLKVEEAESQDPAKARRALRAFEHVYVDMTKKKVHAPEFFGDVAFRRSTCILPATELAIQEGREKPSFDEIACKIYEYATPADLIRVQLMENEKKDEGGKTMDFEDLLKAGKIMYSNVSKESDFREVMKDGTAQKIFAILGADRGYESVHLYDRIMAGFELLRTSEDAKATIAYVENGPIPYGKLDKEVLRHFVKNDDKKLAAWQDGRYGLEPTETGLELYIQAVMNKVQQNPIMPRTDIAATATQAGNKLFRVAANAILKNDKKLMADYATSEKLFNLAFECHNHGLTVEAEQILLNLLKSKGYKEFEVAKSTVETVTE